MTTVTLVYPYFQPFNDRSIFRFPPLGLGYIAAYLRQHKVSVDLVDCTFLSQAEALERVARSDPEIIGIYSMFSIKKRSVELAEMLRKGSRLLVAGGPLPSLKPEAFLGTFDVVVIGEGEQTMLELVHAVKKGADLSGIKGIAYREGGVIKLTSKRGLIGNLDSIPFPAREFFDNKAYMDYHRRRSNHTVTTVITSRGCPFRCDFCSRPIFDERFRARSAKNIADEVEVVCVLGYDRIWFADDCFTFSRKRLIDVCDEMIRRGLRIDWECLSRVDTIDREATEKMRQAGCVRVFFGIESGNDSVLALMNKRTTTKQADEAVRLTKASGIQVGGFFIVGYPGETDETILDTIRFASSLPLDYLSFTLPYPIPGTPLYEREKDKMTLDEPEEPEHARLIDHNLMYRSSFSEAKLKFAIAKGMVQFKMRRHLKGPGYKLLGTPLERLTDSIFRRLH